MIRKMTAMPAAQMGFVRRGMLKVGWAADICVFDPDTVIDRATFKEPAVYPGGHPSGRRQRPGRRRRRASTPGGCRARC